MDSFKQTIRNGNHIVYFGARWCKNCNGIKAEIEAIKGTTVHLYDTDDDDEVTAICGIGTLPTIQIWENGEKIDAFEGRDQCNILLIIQKYFSDVFTDVQYVEEF